MTDIKKVAQAVNDAYENSYTESGLVAALREVANQLQYYYGPRGDMIIDVCDVCSLCEELENL